MGPIFKGGLSFGVLVIAVLALSEGYTGVTVGLVIGLLYFLYADGRNQP